MTNTLSFPGLGIGEFNINEVAFNVFGRNVAWYGIIITFGIIVAFSYALYRSSYEGISHDDILDYTIFTIIPGIIGARAYYVIMDGIENYPTFIDMIAIWNGGLAIYGGLIAGAVSVFIVSRVKKIKFTKVADLISPGVMIAQAIGRWGNFCNAEAYGTETTLPWRMGINHGIFGTEYVHPTFLYESLWNVLGFILINIFYKKKKFDGEIFLSYITWYGFGRMFIEGLRTDSLMLGQVRVSQLLAALCFTVGMTLIIIFHVRAVKKNIYNDAEVHESEIDTKENPQKTSFESIESTDLSDNFDRNDKTNRTGNTDDIENMDQTRT